MMNSFQQQKKLCRWSFLRNEKKTMIKNKQITELFQENK